MKRAARMRQESNGKGIEKGKKVHRDSTVTKEILPPVVTASQDECSENTAELNTPTTSIKTLVPAWKDKTPSFSLVRINSKTGILHQVCIDSGSSISIMDSAYAKKYFGNVKVQPTSHLRVIGLGQTVLTGWIEVDVNFISKNQEENDITLMVQFFLAPQMTTKIIIGNDCLEPHGACINLAEKTLSFKDLGKVPITCVVPSRQNTAAPPTKTKAATSFPSSSTDSHSTTGTVRVKESYTIKPGHNAMVPVEITGMPKGNFVFIEPASDFTTSNIAVGCSVHKTTVKCPVANLVNIGPRPYTLHKGTLLGIPRPVKDQADTPHLFVNIGSANSETSTINHDNTDFNAALISMDINPDLSPNDRKALENVLRTDRRAFAYGDRTLGDTDWVKMEIETGDAKPISSPPYHASPAGRKIIDDTIAELLSEGVIEESDSPWASPVILVRQKGKDRLCIDYRKINDVTKADQYPIPRIDDILSQFAGKSYFTTFDANKGFNQIAVAEQDREKTAFRTHRGLHQYRRMPFGLKNRPSVFQRFTDKVLGRYKWKFALVYIDDIIVYSSNFEEHLHDVQLVLKAIAASGLTLSPKKSHIAYKSIDALGHRISDLGIGTSEGTVRAVNAFPRPHNIKTLQHFLGLTVYYRRHIKDFAKLAAPLYACLKKDAKWDWDSECEGAFIRLKQKLTSAPILAHPNYEQPFILHSDASTYGLGAVLSQINDKKEEHPILYISRSLSPAEANYSATELECLGIVWAVQKLHPYLDGSQFTLITDHSALQWLFEFKGTNRRLLRWAMELQPHRETMTIRYRAGKVHSNADALSRAPLPETHVAEVEADDDWVLLDDKDKFEETVLSTICEHTDEYHYCEDDHYVDGFIDPTNHHADCNLDPSCFSITTPQCNAISTITIPESFLNLVKTGYKSDEHFKKILLGMEINAPEYKRFELTTDGIILYTHPGEENRRMCIPNSPPSLRVDLLHDHHDALCAGHLGTAKTSNNITQGYYWHGMAKDVKEYVRSCSSCQRNKPSQIGPSGLLQPLDIPPSRWHTVTMDFAGPLPISGEGNWDMIFIVVDKLTRVTHLIPAKSTDTAPITAKRFFNGIVRLHGLPSVIVSDRDSKFTSLFWTSLFDQFGVKLAMSSAFHPQTDGQTEKLVGTTKQMLSHFVSNKQNNWSDHLPVLEFAYNNSLHPSTGLTPFELDLGRHPATPHTILGTAINGTTRRIQAADEFVQTQQASLIQAQDTIQHAQQQQALYHNCGRTDRGGFKVGDLVMLSTQYVRPAFLRTKGSRKLRAKFIGPFSITKRVSSTAYELDLPSNLKVHPVINLQYLKEYHSNPPKFPGRSEPQPPPIMDAVNEVLEYEVEKVVAHRDVRGSREYLIHWKGYEDHDDTWEPLENLANADESIQEYHQSPN